MSASWTVKEVSLDSDHWQSLSDSGTASLFQTELWGRVTAEGLHGQPTGLVFERDGEAVCGLAAFTRRILWARLLFSHVPYGGLIGDCPPDLPLAELLQRHGRRTGLTRIRLVDHPGQMLPQAGFACIDGATHVLAFDGRSYDELWTGFKKKIRRDVRVAIKNDVVADGRGGPEQFREFYDLYLESMARNEAVPKYGFEFVDAIRRHIVAADRGALFVARHQERAVAGVLIVDSPAVSHYLMGGSHAPALKYCPNDLLLNEAMKRAVERGLTAFDFLPSGVGDESLARFKTKWGAKPIPVRTLDLITRPLSMATWSLAYRTAESAPIRRMLQAYRRRST